MQNEIQHSFVNRYIFLFFRFYFEFRLNFQPTAALVHFNSALLAHTNQKKAFCICIFTQTPTHIHTCKYTLACVVRVRVSCLFLCKWHFSYFSIFRYLFNFPLPFNSSILNVGIAPKANCIRYYSYFIY